MSTRVKRIMSSFYPFLLLWFVLAAWAGPAQADVAANIHFVSGYVSAKAPGVAERQLAKGGDIFTRDRIDTADNGRIQMRFTDGGLVSLMPNTTFSVDEYFHDGGADDDASLVFGLLKGGLRTVTGTIGQVQHDQYELKTPVATLGIRGTEYVAVLRPANTLRVHVGRGKVVITNDQGSLEVPEGHNAVVTLGSAPEFSEQGPQYQATGPMGDRLTAVYQHHQDPHLLNPQANMPPPGLASFDGVPSSGGSSVLPPGTSVLPAGTYQMAAMSPFGFGVTYLPGTHFEFNSDGHMSGSEIGMFDTGNWQSFDVVTSGELSWGAYTDGTGGWGSTPLSVGQEQFLPYVVGSAVVNMPQTGILSYSMAGPSTAFRANSDGTTIQTGALTRFNLDIDLDTTQYRLDMNMTVGSEQYFTITPGAWSSVSLSGSEFSFSGHGVDGGGCLGDCHLSGAGFLAGDNAGQAGVLYQFQEGNETVYGAAGLER